MSTQRRRTPVTVRLDNPDLTKIDELAREEQRDRSQMIRVLLRHELDRRARRSSS